MLVVLTLITVTILFLVGCNNSGSVSTEKKDYTKDNPLIVKFSHVAPDQSAKGQGALKFKELLEEKTDGRVEVQVFPSSQLYNDNNEVEALQGGNVEIIAPSTAKLVGFNPAFQVNDLPFLFEDVDAVHRFWDGDAGQELFSSIEGSNIKGLAIWDLGSKIFISKKPIEKLEDFKGQKFRTQAGQVLESQFDALGAIGVTLPFSEVYTGLQQGTIDGLENTWTSIDEQKFYEVQKHALLSYHGRIDYVLLTNNQWYNDLPLDIKEAFDESVAEATKFEREIITNLNSEAEKRIREQGDIKFYELSDNELKKFRDAVEEVYKEYEDIIGKEFIDAARES